MSKLWLESMEEWIIKMEVHDLGKGNFQFVLTEEENQSLVGFAIKRILEEAVGETTTMERIVDKLESALEEIIGLHGYGEMSDAFEKAMEIVRESEYKNMGFEPDGC